MVALDEVDVFVRSKKGVSLRLSKSEDASVSLVFIFESLLESTTESTEVGVVVAESVPFGLNVWVEEFPSSMMMEGIEVMCFCFSMRFSLSVKGILKLMVGFGGDDEADTPSVSLEGAMLLWWCGLQ